MSLKLLEQAGHKLMGIIAKPYQTALGSQLNRYGLRYEDLVNENYAEVSEALSLADKDIQTGRTRRIKRAIDLSFKRKDLTDYAPNMKLEPFKFELMDDIEKIKARDREFADLKVR